MRNLLCILLFAALSLSVSAQKVSFVYLQTENSNPFYVKMDDKIYSSSSSGYLILSNLVDSTYTIVVGFPSTQAESKFSIQITGKDRGFLIKNLQQGITLFDLQSLSLINEQKDQSQDNITYQKREDNFASILSKAANDTSLLYAVVKKEEPLHKEQLAENTKLQKEEPKVVESGAVKDTGATMQLQTAGIETKIQDTSAIVQSKQKETNPTIDTSSTLSADTLYASTTGTSNLQAEKKDSLSSITRAETANKVIDTTLRQTSGVRNLSVKRGDTIASTSPLTNGVEQTFKRSTIKKHSESSTSEGFGLVYYDKYEDGIDTIRLIIPNPKFTFKADADSSQTVQLVNREDVKISEPKEDTLAQQVVLSTSNLKYECKAIANDNDFFKLRKTMAAKETDEAMIEEAKKAFKSKCFSTEQVKNLSTLFLTSAGKYQFFDAAYFHVSDQQQFPSLQSEIRDDYYLKRFKALIGE